MNLPDISAMYRDAASSPQMQRGLVWCHECGKVKKVNAAACLRHGWPKCCGYTMSLDSPEERSKP